ncbi:hypothetical protein MTO96_023339 [Rhipicephalus appendiculatus]
MATTSKRIVYVGGLAEEVDEKVLHAAFIPFGDLVDVQIPTRLRDGEKHRGFAFVEFESAEDAAAAIDNMNDSELFGRTIRVNIAKPMKIKEGDEAEAQSDDKEVGEKAKKSANPQVYLDISVDGQEIGRVRIILYKDVVPRTAENFRCLCTHERGFGFIKSTFHRIIPGFMCQGGDITNHNGTGGRSIYGRKFDDENFELKHTGPGILSMANSGPNSNSSQFFLTTAKTDWLDGKHVVFGQVISGMEVVRKMETYGSSSGKVSKKVEICNSGEYT